MIVRTSLAMVSAVCAVTLGSSGLKLPELFPRRASRESRQEAQAEPDPEVHDAAVPEVTLPERITGVVDTFIRIDAKTNGKSVEFFPIDDGLAIFPSKMLISPKSTVIFPKVARDFRVAAYTSLNDELSEPKIFVVHVTDPSPSPEPTPPPKPNVPDPIPVPKPTPLSEGKLGLIASTRDAIVAGIPAAKRGTAKLIAGNYAVVSAQIAAGTIKTLAEAASTIKTMNRASVQPADVSLWTPVFVQLNAKVNGLGITSLTDWQQAFTELGQGFSAAGGE